MARKKKLEPKRMLHSLRNELVNNEILMPDSEEIDQRCELLSLVVQDLISASTIGRLELGEHESSAVENGALDAAVHVLVGLGSIISHQVEFESFDQFKEIMHRALEAAMTDDGDDSEVCPDCGHAHDMPDDTELEPAPAPPPPTDSGLN